MQILKTSILTIGILWFGITTAKAQTSASDVKKERPKIGVVLSGGGAKGTAHIGALKVIEQVGLPVDYVVGTSMGSIVGGLYAIGYTANELDSIVCKQDWSFLLSDRVEREEQTFAEREANQKHVINVPLNGKKGLPSISGVIQGKNLSNVFNELTIGYHDSIDFNRLPIPFACVTEDIVTGDEVVFHNGVLATAMRASMAIPGVFTPVRLHGKVLADGGLCNNYPVDVVRRMGADIVIGVDVKDELNTAQSLTSLPAVFGQLIDLMGLEKYKQNKELTNVYIKVNVSGYSAASFSASAIDSLIVRGETAANNQLEKLYDLRKMLVHEYGYEPMPKQPLTAQQEKHLVNVNTITFEGLNATDSHWVMKRTKLKEHAENDIDLIKSVTGFLRSNLGFTNVTYKLHQTDTNSYNLIYVAESKMESKVSLGIRFDSEDISSLLIGAELYNEKVLPGVLSVAGKLGKNYLADVNYAIRLGRKRSFNLNYQFRRSNIDFFEEGQKIANVTSRKNLFNAYLQSQRIANTSFMVGAQYEHIHYNNSLGEGEWVLLHGAKNEHMFTFYANGKLSNYKDKCYPEKGYSINLNAELYTGIGSKLTKNEIEKTQLAANYFFETVIPVTTSLAVLPALYGRVMTYGNGPFCKRNVIGSDYEGKYLDQQLPFTGINQAQVVYNELAMARLKVRQRLAKLHYVSLIGNYALTSQEFDNFFKGWNIWGVGLCYGYNSILGPLEFTVSYSNMGNKVATFLNLGYKF